MHFRFDKYCQQIVVLYRLNQLGITGKVENEHAREKDTGIYLLTGENAAFTELFYKKVDDRKE